MKFSITIILISLFISSLHSQPLQVNWQHCYGGSNYENGYTIVKSTNSFVLFCGTDSHDGDVTGYHGGYGDYWLIKSDTSGNILWTKTYGGVDEEDASDMKQTPDGGFILFGSTSTISVSGEVVGNHGGYDFWLVKIDSLGTIEWSKCLGGSCDDEAYKIDLTQDGGFICIGYSCSNDGDVTVNHGMYDIWIVKLDQTGTILWQNSFGGTSIDWGMCVHSTSDGGAIVGGAISSVDGNIQCNYHGGNGDIWVAKLDSFGDIEWQKCFGGTGYESVVSIIPTDDGGYIYTGVTNSNDGDVSGNHGDDDVWVVKLDNFGNLVWQKCYGGTAMETGLVIKKSNDGNYFIGGYTFSNDGDVSGNHSLIPYFSDIWLIKISPVGDLIWQQCLGGIGSEGLEDLLELPGGRMMLLGGTHTDDYSGDVQCAHHGPGTSDVWLLSVSDTTYVGNHEIKGESFKIWISPNPVNEDARFNATNPNYACNTIIKIINNFGQVINSFILYKGESNILFNCHSISSGLYYYTYSNDHFNGAGKIMITH